MTLVGTWVVKAADKRALAELGDVVLEFQQGGLLTYTIRSIEKDQIIRLRYRIEGSVIVTDQPSDPKVERTVFGISDDGILTLAFGGKPYQFERLS